MRVVQNSQIRLGELSIAEIRIDERSRDDIPAVLRGLQEIYTHDEKREQLFALLEESLTSKTRHTTGRPGMQLWRIFVLATLKQGLNCDFDRLQQYANHHDTVRQMLGHGDWDDDTKYPMQTLVDNISLLSAEKLAEISQLVVEHGHEWVKKRGIISDSAHTTRHRLRVGRGVRTIATGAVSIRASSSIVFPSKWLTSVSSSMSALDGW